MISFLPPHPALLIRSVNAKTLVTADLHIGWEMALQEKGIHVPNQTLKLQHRLNALLRRHTPDRLVVLGDVKYSVVTADAGEWRDIPDFFSEALKHVQEIIVVRGNHDANLEPLLPENVKLQPATGIIIDDVGLFHGHKWPAPTLLKCRTLVMGHLHPVVTFRDPAGFKATSQVWVNARIDAATLAGILLRRHGAKPKSNLPEDLEKHCGFKPKTTRLIIMPSFNDLLGGRPINEPADSKRKGNTLIGPALRSSAVDLETAEVFLLDGTYLGTLSQMRRLS
jgi:putative SbcD/Mre11-related phosphoesterase